MLIFSGEIMKPRLFQRASSTIPLKHAITFLVTVMLPAVCISACAGFGTRLESPRISLSNLALQETTGFETVLRVSLRVLNPNDIDLNIRGVDCSLEINGKPFARGISNAAVQVPPFGSATVPITVYSSAVDIARGLISVPGRKELNYELKGKLRLEKTGWLLSGLPFKSGGTVPIKDFQAWLDPKLH
jgi:LEA14-like dessication related protein